MTDLIAIRDPKSPIVASYRTVCAGLHRTKTDAPLKIIGITGVAFGAAKSVAVANLAVVMAQAGKKTLLVDACFANPQQHELFAVKNEGLSECIAAGGDLGAFRQGTSQSGLDIVAAGTAAVCIASAEKLREMLAGLEQEYDAILLDVPAVLESADALSVAVASDGALLVVESGVEKPGDARLAKKRLLQAKAQILGCVLNNAEVGKGYELIN